MPLDSFQQQAATVAVKKMFQGSYFSICDLDALITLIGCILPTKDYQALKCLHCVQWSDMPPELRNVVMERVVGILQSSGFDTEVLDGKVLKFRSELKQISSKG